ncbi:hypothetical protein [Helicobacter pylori]|nr:hypothetical protein [Helicobacter pylori]UOR43464.1 hypothetical protein MPG62_07195 [Helicobacter pylori]
MIETELFKTPKNKTNQQQKRMASIVILIALNATKFLLKQKAVIPF